MLFRSAALSAATIAALHRPAVPGDHHLRHMAAALPAAHQVMEAAAYRGLPHITADPQPLALPAAVSAAVAAAFHAPQATAAVVVAAASPVHPAAAEAAAPTEDNHENTEN